MFHPNVYADGSICLDILQNRWSPTYDVSSILTSIQSLLDEPNPNSPANSQAAQLYQENKREYEKRVSAIVEQSWRDCWPCQVPTNTVRPWESWSVLSPPCSSIIALFCKLNCYNAATRLKPLSPWTLSQNMFWSACTVPGALTCQGIFNFTFISDHPPFLMFFHSLSGQSISGT